MDWREAGVAGGRAAEWAYPTEPHARAANDRLFDELGVGSDVRLLDVACGSGYACWVAAQLRNGQRS